MKKKEFVRSLKTKLFSLPKQEAKERVNFYIEMIDDRIEEGLTEEEAVAAIGPINEIVQQILEESPSPKRANGFFHDKKDLFFTGILLGVIGFPIWFPVLVTAISIIFSLYVTIWALIISLWTTCFSMTVGGLVGLLGSFIVLFTNGPAASIFIFASSLISIGLSIFLSIGCMAAVEWWIILTKACISSLIRAFSKKEKCDE